MRILGNLRKDNVRKEMLRKDPSWLKAEPSDQSSFQKLLLLVKNYEEVIIKYYCFYSALLDFFTFFQIFCPRLST